MSSELSTTAFEAKYRELVASLGSRKDNEGCVECIACRSCTQCTFCRDSERMVRCHYCVRCALCIDSSHCRSSKSLTGCNHCNEAEACTQSSYLVLCVAMSQCTYCFGCAGLSGKDFHILNEPYGRTEYFAMLKRLSSQLGISRA